MPSARALTLRVLQRWELADTGTYAEHLIDQEVARHQLSSRDRAQLVALTHGTLRHRTLLDHWLAKLLSKTPPRKLRPDVRRLLHVGLFDLLIHSAAPHAAVSEAVGLAPKSFRSLVNALLRRADRERETLMATALDLPLHIRFSHPEFLIDRWLAQFGRENTIRLLEWNNSPPTTYLRTNRLHPDNPDGPVEITRAESPDFAALLKGLNYAQDPSTLTAPCLLAPRPGERILDACAAPGGKTAVLAELMGNSGEIVATDSSALRLETLSSNLEKLRVGNSRIHQHDWANSNCPGLGDFDAILLDVPCSNTGVFGRRVDARWRISADSIAALTHLQFSIAKNAARHLKPGGRLVYSTCSIEEAENIEMANKISSTLSQFHLKEFRQTLPHEKATDGSFAALLTT